MKNDFEVKGIKFSIRPYTPRHNEFERGLKYKLCLKCVDTYEGLLEPDVIYTDTGFHFSGKREAKRFATKNVY